MKVFIVLFWLSVFIIFWAMIGYPLSLLLIDKFFKFKDEEKDYTHVLSVTVMVVAHNEEQIIQQKLENLIQLNYPKERLEILVTSDNSTDGTNEIIKNFIKEHPSFNIRLFEVVNRMGKTNAQNEAQKTVKSDILVMTDANAMLDADAVRELVASFTSEKIAYVTGRLVYINEENSPTSASESDYWNLDLKIRDIESRIQTITAGNGALYACRTSEYVDFDPIKSHDSMMPLYYGLQQRRAIMNSHALVYEKAGETQEDEFGRKVRMNRVLLGQIIPDFRMFNMTKYKWFSYFYFGHRTCRNALWLAHFLIFLSNIFIVNVSQFYFLSIGLQIIFYLFALIQQIFNTESKVLSLINYYTMTIVAQWVGVIHTITGKSKPFWEKAETTR